MTIESSLTRHPQMRASTLAYLQKRDDMTSKLQRESEQVSRRYRISTWHVGPPVDRRPVEGSRAQGEGDFELMSVDRFVVSAACISAALFMLVRLIEGGDAFHTVMRVLTMIMYSYYAYSVLRRGVQ